MTPLVVIQARMGSTRLPGKVLLKVSGIPLLDIMLTRLRPLEGCRCVVATTTDPRDAAIVEHCQAIGVDTICGDEFDVLSRYVLALDSFGGDPIVRLTADCPLSDPLLIRQALEAHSLSKASFTSNTLVRTFPVGLDIEVMSPQALREAAAEAVDPIEREHVTPFIYRRPERFSLHSLRTAHFAGNERWTVDYPSDLRVVKDVLSLSVDWRTAGWAEILAAVGRRCTPSEGSLVLRPVEAADRNRLLAWRNEDAAVRFSGSGRPVEPAEHGAWFDRILECPATRIWIGMAGETPVGQIRTDVTTGVAEVAISVAAGSRGLGYGTGLLMALLDTATRGDYQVVSYTARVHFRNEPSLRTFAACGFIPQTREGDFIMLARDR